MTAAALLVTVGELIMTVSELMMTGAPAHGGRIKTRTRTNRRARALGLNQDQGPLCRTLPTVPWAHGSILGRLTIGVEVPSEPSSGLRSGLKHPTKEGQGVASTGSLGNLLARCASCRMRL